MKNLVWVVLLAVSPDVFANADTVIVRSGLHQNRISDDWKSALKSRLTAKALDSMAAITRPLSAEESQWKKLIESKGAKWNSFKDSLAVPFRDVVVRDTIYVMLGYLGVDDAFTWKYQTVCFDLTALQQNYGSANDPVNNERIDRIFSHEFTHLLHREWVRKNKLEVRSFRDSILWECLYEGVGMYRSLSEKWWISNGVIPEVTKQAVADLEPVFADRITAVLAKSNFTQPERRQLNRNLSRGPVNKKWGAFLVAIWLMKEANGNEANLRTWIDAGPNGILTLSKKHLSEIHRGKIPGLTR
jgi:Putative zinc dependent peptidase (DUF5700)